MGSVDKEQLMRVREFIKDHPEEAKKVFEENPDALQKLTGNEFSDNKSNNLEGGNSMGGNQLTKSIPGVPKMFDWDNNGFSNYLMLAVLAFSIQFIITLVCIFFYK